MRCLKRVCMLFALTMLLCSSIVFADNVGIRDVIRYPEPSDSVLLISKADSVYGGTTEGTYILDNTDTLRLRLYGSNSYKVLCYNKGKVYTNIADDYGDGTLKEVTKDISGGIKSAAVLSDSDSFEAKSGSDSYIIYLSSNATSLNDVKYVVRTKNIVNHVKDYNLDDDDDSKTDKSVFSISVVKYLYDSNKHVSGATFKATWNLSKYKEEAFGIDFGEKTYIELDGTKGSQTFDVDGLSNEDYLCSLNTDGVTKFVYNVKVDFITGTDDAKTDKFDDEIKEEDMITPKVTFSKIPKRVDEGDSFTLTMNSSVKAYLNFDNTTLANNELAKSAKIKITDNGVYYYSATSKGGSEKTGVLKINCFKPAKETKDDAINNDLTMTSATTLLSQTGIEIILPILLGVAFIVIGAILVCRQEKGGNTSEK